MDTVASKSHEEQVLDCTARLLERSLTPRELERIRNNGVLDRALTWVASEGVEEAAKDVKAALLDAPRRSATPHDPSTFGWLSREDDRRRAVTMSNAAMRRAEEHPEYGRIIRGFRSGWFPAIDWDCGLMPDDGSVEEVRTILDQRAEADFPARGFRYGVADRMWGMEGLFPLWYFSFGLGHAFGWAGLDRGEATIACRGGWLFDVALFVLTRYPIWLSPVQISCEPAHDAGETGHGGGIRLLVQPWVSPDGVRDSFDMAIRYMTSRQSRSRAISRETLELFEYVDRRVDLEEQPLGQQTWDGIWRGWRHRQLRRGQPVYRDASNLREQYRKAKARIFDTRVTTGTGGPVLFAPPLPPVGRPTEDDSQKVQ